MPQIKDKIIIILDLEFDSDTYTKLSGICRKIITIDDHKSPNLNKVQSVHALRALDSRMSKK